MPLSKVWKKWVNICLSLNRLLRLIFSKWATFAGTYPKAVIAVCFVIALCLMGGFFRFKMQNQSERLYMPQNSKARQYLDRADKSFPVKAIPNEFILTRKDGGSILTVEAFTTALMLHNGIKRTRIDQICTKLNRAKKGFESCFVEGVLELFQYNESKITEVPIQSTLQGAYNDDSKLMMNGRPSSYTFPRVLGHFSVENKTIKSDAIRMLYYVYYAETSEAYQKLLPIEDEFINFLQSKQKEIKAKGMVLFLNAGKSLDDSVNKSSGGDISLVAISITLMCIFTTFSLSSCRDMVGGHLVSGKFFL